MALKQQQVSICCYLMQLAAQHHWLLGMWWRLCPINFHIYICIFSIYVSAFQMFSKDFSYMDEINPMDLITTCLLNWSIADHWRFFPHLLVFSLLIWLHWHVKKITRVLNFLKTFFCLSLLCLQSFGIWQIYPQIKNMHKKMWRGNKEKTTTQIWVLDSSNTLCLVSWPSYSLIFMNTWTVAAVSLCLSCP